MESRKRRLFGVRAVIGLILLCIAILVKAALDIPFSKNIKEMNIAISECNMKKAEEYYNDASKERFKESSALKEAWENLQGAYISVQEYDEGVADINKGNSLNKEGKKFDGTEYKEAIKEFQMIDTNSIIKKSQEDLNLATTDYVDGEFTDLKPDINARHYVDAYNKLNNDVAFIYNTSISKEYLNKIKALEDENNIDLDKATGIAVNKVNEVEDNIQTLVGIVDNDYITYSYPTGKINFITKEQNGVIDGQEGFLYLVEQVQRENNNLNHLDSYFYVFVNMDSGKAKIYDSSILKSFKSTFKVTEFKESNAVVQKYMKNFNIPNCFEALQDVLRAQNLNKITHLESLFDENKFINTVLGYKELYEKPHQLFSAYGNEYYLVTPEEIYKVQGDKLIKQGKTTLSE